MKVLFFAVGIIACLITVVAAWSKEDQEIFRLKDEVEASEGPEVTFYDFLGVSRSANQDDINKAYRKKSRQIHPDKVKQKFIADRAKAKSKSKGSKAGVHVSKSPSQAEIKAATKEASERFARLGIVANILRGSGRERYDHFLTNGFPKWKGTGYYYARFRPGLGTVLTGLFIFVGGGGHYLALYTSWKRHREFVQRYITFARNAALGENLGIPGLDNVGGSGSGTATPNPENDAGEVLPPMNRRQRRLQEKDAKKSKGGKAEKSSKSNTPPPAAASSTGPKKRVVAENGKVLCVDMAGNVYLEQVDEDGVVHEFLLDPNELAQPTIKDTALYRLPIWVYNRIVGRTRGTSSGNFDSTGHTLDGHRQDESSDEDDNNGGAAVATPSSSSGAEDFEVLEKVKTTAQNGKATRRKGKGKK
ncbi:hypothetical protein F5884DRAFT_176423 [Xylogone sp. PMI_703]|nr:hypothetical protein F5884DRAFT_176423 [Xylogone sp. PMI_703]